MLDVLYRMQSHLDWNNELWISVWMCYRLSFVLYQVIMKLILDVTCAKIDSMPGDLYDIFIDVLNSIGPNYHKLLLSCIKLLNASLF